MPRAFNGSASITTSIGGLGAFNFGTMAAIARRADNNNWHGIVVTIQSGGGANEAYLDIAPTSHATAGAIWSSWGSTDNAATLKFLAADGWCIVACTKATGSATPRYHKYVFATQAWTHDNGGGAVGNATSTPGGNIKFGDVGGDTLTGDLAAAALYARTFTDQEIESLAVSWETWLGYGPAGAWLFDQDATAQTLLDWTGGGANQSAITGTSVQTASLPGWNVSDGAVWAAEVIAGGGATPISLTDTGSATDTASIAAAAPLTETPAAADAAAVTAALTAADTAAGADAATLSAAAALADTAAAADAGGTSATAALADAAAAADAVTVDTGATPKSLADTAASADTLGLTAAAAPAELAAAADALALTAVVAFADAAAAADVLVVGRAITLADAASADDGVTTVVPPALVGGTGSTFPVGGSSTYPSGRQGGTAWRS